MFVVRRSFRNGGCMLPVGSIVEPTGIKWFKTRLKDRYIVEVNAHNFNEWQMYFKDKLNVELNIEDVIDLSVLQQSTEGSETTDGTSEQHSDSTDGATYIQDDEKQKDPQPVPAKAKATAKVNVTAR